MARPSRARGWVAKYGDSWYARIEYRDETGRLVQRKRAGRTRAEAKDRLEELRAEIADKESSNQPKKTFDELLAYYKENYVVPPVYVDGRKVWGLRRHLAVVSLLKPLEAHFQGLQLQEIRYRHLVSFKTTRLAQPVLVGKQQLRKQRSIICVNRELEVLRKMFNVAVREGWLDRNPFSTGEPLINHADERHRERYISEDEEARLLAACTGRQAHLKAILICALDTGMRPGEIFKTTWADVHLEEGFIYVPAFNTKTMRERWVGITPRLRECLLELGPGEGLVFGVETSVKKAFKTVKRRAGLEDLRLYDCRHTAATRLITGGLQLAEVGQVLGHTQVSTTLRYVVRTQDVIRRAAQILAEVGSRLL